MTKICTVLGPIHPQQLGTTNMHEHLIWANAGWDSAPEAGELFNPPEIFKKLYDTLTEYKAAGGKTVVDCSGLCMGRDVELYATLAKYTGVNIVACTGFWAQENVVPYFLSAKTGGGHAFKDIDYFQDLFIRELTRGMGATNIPAGFIKVGNSKSGITPFEERTYRAAARASRQTGAAIITHGINFALRQVEIFQEEKVDPERVVISHCDAAYSLDFERDKEIARQGFYVGYDHIGYEPEWSPMPYAMSDAKRVELCQAFIDAGFAKQLIISCDAEPVAVGWGNKAMEHMHGYAHLLRSFIPRLKDAGISEEIINQLVVETPKKLLPF